MLLGVFEDGVLGVVVLGVEGRDSGFFGADGLGLAVVRGGRGT